jgi:hypothetical protein
MLIRYFTHSFPTIFDLNSSTSAALILYKSTRPTATGFVVPLHTHTPIVLSFVSSPRWKMDSLVRLSKLLLADLLLTYPSSRQPLCLRSQQGSTYFLHPRVCCLSCRTYLAMLVSEASSLLLNDQTLLTPAISHYKCFKLIGLHSFCAVLFTAGYALREYGAFNYLFISREASMSTLLVYILSQVLIYVCP